MSGADRIRRKGSSVRQRPAWVMATVLAASLGAPLVARGPATDAQTDSCTARSGGVTVALHDCFAAAAQRADARLNTAYRRAGTGLAPAVRARLVAAQRAWLRFRELDCAVVGAREAGGSDAPLAVDECFVSRTDTRAAELDDLARS